MASIGNLAAHIKRQKAAQSRSHRRAFGAHRTRTPEERARHIAQSIALRQDEERAWTWATYGLEKNPMMQALVKAALATLR